MEIRKLIHKVLDTLGILPLILIAPLAMLSGCFKAPISKCFFATPRPAAIQDPSGEWIALIPRCQQLQACPSSWFTLEHNYFGCSTAHNLGLMIAKPKDLVFPIQTLNHPIRRSKNG